MRHHSTATTENEKKYSWQTLLLCLFSSIAIAICCGINAFFYLGSSHIIFLSSPFIVLPCVFASFALNFMLYMNDSPESFENIFSIFKTKKRWTWQDCTIIIPQECIAIISGIVIALFTYHSFVMLSLPFINHSTCIALCIFYGTGTYALNRNALSAFFEYAKTINYSGFSVAKKIIFICLIALFMYATWSVIYTQFIATLATIIIPKVVIYIAFTCLFISDACFAWNVAAYITQNIDKLRKNNWYELFLLAFGLLNAVSNGAIAASDSGKIKAISGGTLSFMTMTKAVKEDNENNNTNKTWYQKLREQQNLVHATTALIYIVLAVFIPWITHDLLLPLIMTHINHSSIITATSIISIMVLALASQLERNFIATINYKISPTHIPNQGSEKLINLEDSFTALTPFPEMVTKSLGS